METIIFVIITLEAILFTFEPVTTAIASALVLSFFASSGGEVVYFIAYKLKWDQC